MIFLERFPVVPWVTEFTKMNETVFPNFVVSVRVLKIEKLLLISFLFVLHLWVLEILRRTFD